LNSSGIAWKYFWIVNLCRMISVKTLGHNGKNYYILTFLAISCTALYVWCCLMMFALFYMWDVTSLYLSLLLFVLILLYKIGGQLDECLLLWHPSGIFLYSTIIILVCFMLCCRIKYDDDYDVLWVYVTGSGLSH